MTDTIDLSSLEIATRVGVTVSVFDANGNLLDVIGPAQRGTPAQSLSCIIGDAFKGGVPVTFTGDWLTQNNYDGFDRLVTATDPLGGTTLNTFDPGGRAIATQRLGTAGGPTPTDRGGARNVLLASDSTRFDEAGRAYELQRDVFLDSALYGSGPGSAGHGLPSRRAVTHTGGGLAINSTSNNHTGTVTLTAGGTSYVLTRNVFDRDSRMTATATDNAAVTAYAFDGASRQLTMTDPLGNATNNTFDGNGNAITTTRSEKCTIPGVNTALRETPAPLKETLADYEKVEVWPEYPDAELVVDRLHYVQREGSLNRGPEFQKLLMCLDRRLAYHRKFRSLDVQYILGPPDLLSKADGENSYIYYFQPQREVEVNFDDKGILASLEVRRQRGSHPEFQPFSVATTHAS